MKKTKTLLAALALTVAPTLAMAMGCSGYGHETPAQSCIAGTAWDADKGACVPVNATS